MKNTIQWRAFAFLCATLAMAPSAEAQDPAEALASARHRIQAAEGTEHAKVEWAQFSADYPAECDWLMQDIGSSEACLAWLSTPWDEAPGQRLLPSALETLAGHARDPLGALSYTEELDWGRGYFGACQQRRRTRLAPLLDQWPAFVFTKHYDLGGSHYAYTEGQSDAQRERTFLPGASLCVLELDTFGGTVRTLLEDPDGVIRDPDVSYDGKRILFSWKKSDRQDDYHLYEMDYASGALRQLTDGLGFADYEGAYLPNGDIIFNSSRCVQTVDCWWTEVSNLYTCDRDGNYLRRLSFDQVHTNYPTVTEDGRVLYTRWDYNDRGQIYPQPLFQMFPDGTGQTEFYGNNAWFPTTILHARGIPGSTKIVAVLSGHHTRQRGKLGLIDVSHGRQEADGVQLIAPFRETPAERIDRYGQNGDQFQYPYPLDETRFLVGYSPYEQSTKERSIPFCIYFMDADGKRELLAWDPDISCNQPVPLCARPLPHLRPSPVDHRKTTGTYYVHDVYQGPGLAGVPRGSIKYLRVVALEYRPAGIGDNRNGGPAGAALVSTPIAVGNGAWDVKVVLGDAPVHEDGSAFFIVPARTPVYFQAIDEKGHAAQTMRTWSTLQPGEDFSCVGCHESKDEAPPAQYGTSEAMRRGPQTLEPFHGPARGFSFAKEIQPILDRHCTACHNDQEQRPKDLPLDGMLDSCLVAPREAMWRFALEPPPPGWEQPDFDGSAWPEAQAGFGRTGTAGGTINTPWLTSEIWMRRSFDLDPEQLGREFVLYLCHDEDVELYCNGVLAARVPGVSTDFVRLPASPGLLAALRPGANTLAMHCRQTGGGQFVDVAVAAFAPAQREGKRAFSLLGEPVLDAFAKRYWSDAYLNLLRAERDLRDGKAMAFRAVPNDLVSWAGTQSVPSMLAPYESGAARSRLMAMLDEGHGNVTLSREEREKMACWIDLFIPFCGDYHEANAWTEKELAFYKRFMEKRKKMEAIERRSIEALLRTQELPPMAAAETR